ncbi:MAG: ATP-binding domain-containing protein, partial [Caldimonas sp.]
AIEEERRLLYVAMTRARHHLHLLVPQRFYVTEQSAWGDRHVYGAISRFIPAEIRGLFDQITASDAPMTRDAVDPAEPVIDLGARLRALWR